MKVYFNADKLNNSCLDSLSSLRSKLLTARNGATSFDVPSVYYDYFKYSSYLRNLHSDISDIITECDKIESWVKSSIRSFESFSDDTVNSFNRIEDIDISVRSSIVVAK